MIMEALEIGELLFQIVYYFPWYVFLVMVPMVLRGLLDRVFGIRYSIFYLPAPVTLAYETAFRQVTYEVLYLPLFEELVFRAATMYFFGYWGFVVGNIIWVLLHPSWQLQYLRGFPTWKKVAFTLTSVFYYSCCAMFYGMMWLAGAGVAAIAYHVVHNGWLTAFDMMREIEIEMPSLRKQEPVFVVEKPKFVVAKKEAKASVSSSKFVRRKMVGNSVEEVFVKRKLKNIERE